MDDDDDEQEEGEPNTKQCVADDNVKHEKQHISSSFSSF